jgi:hypothetical protein
MARQAFRPPRLEITIEHTAMSPQTCILLAVAVSFVLCFKFKFHSATNFSFQRDKTGWQKMDVESTTNQQFEEILRVANKLWKVGKWK